jgi:hypothetical protein
MFEEMCWREGTGGCGGTTRVGGVTTSVDGGKRSSILGRRVLCIYIVENMYSIIYICIVDNMYSTIYICCQFHSMYSDYVQLGIPM